MIFAGLGAAQAGVGLIDWALYGWGGFQVFALLTSAALLLTALLILSLIHISEPTRPY